MYARNFKFQVSVHFRGGAALILLQSFSKKKKVKAEVKLYATLEGKKKKGKRIPETHLLLLH